MPGITLNTSLGQGNFLLPEDIESWADNNSTSVLLLDKDYNLLQCNSKAKTTFSINENGIGRPICELLGDVFDEKEILSHDRINYHLTLKEKQYLVSSFRVDKEKGPCFLIFLYNLTQDCDDQSSLQDSLLQSDLFGVYVFDGEKFIFFNNTIERMTGYTADELNAMSVWDLLAFSGDKIKLRDRALQRIKGKNGPLYQELTICRKDGSHLVGFFNLKIVQYQGKKAILGIVIDVTERRKFEKVVEQYQKLEMLNRMTHHIYHDFNNFLTVIMGYLSLIGDNMNPADPLKKHIEVAEQAGDKAAGLVQELMSLSKKQDLNMEALNVNIVIGSALKLLDNSFIQKNISITRHLSDSLPPIKADHIKLEQVFLNLFLNAIEATGEKGEIEVRTEKIRIRPEQQLVQKTLDEGDYVRVMIKDNGCGVDADKIPLVWEPYYTTKKQKGGGLGLSVAYGVILAHNGDIQLESVKGKGTTITIHLPIPSNTDEQTKQKMGLIEKGKGKVLVVEDDLVVKRMLSEVLINLGYQVFDISDGLAAVEFYRERIKEGNRMDLVILDVALPGLNGKDVFKELKKMDPDVMAILSSGYHFDETEKMKTEGIAGFLSKPYSIADISQRIKTILKT